jgi:hypothetical protein
MALVWSSRYLARGFAQDDIELHDLTIDNESATCRFSVNVGRDGPHPFHLSTISAHRVMAQCGIDFICHALGMSKEALGEVWELSHSANYRRKVLSSHDLHARLQLVSRGWTRNLSTWLFQFDVEDGSFQGTIELAPGKPISSPEGALIYDPSTLPAYVDHYLSFYGEEAASAKSSTAVYKPKACIAFRPSTALSAQLRALAADMSICLQQLYRSYNSGNHLCAHDSVSRRVPTANRPSVPSMIRLDVIETSEGCKVIEVNAGNCGGIETYYRMYSFLRERLFPIAPVVPKLLSLLLNIIAPTPHRRAIFAYLDDGQSKYLSTARKGILESINPQSRIEVCHMRDLIENRAELEEAEFIYRDFIYEELDLNTELGRTVEDLLLGLPASRYFPSLSDEALSDKSYIAEVDRLVRTGLASRVGLNEGKSLAWKRWMAPSTPLTKGTRHSATIGFGTPHGVVLKPADGYGGDGVTILPSCVLPLNASFYGGRSWVVQRYYEAPQYRLMRRGNKEEQVRLVHGVFLLPRDGRLEYGGIFTRLSPDPVVNIGNDGDVVLFCEPDWFHDGRR